MLSNKRLVRSFFHKALSVFCLASLLLVSPVKVLAEEERLSDTDYIPSTAWPVADEIDAEAAILIDADSGMVLYAKGADSFRYPASTTKILTALLVMENCSMDDEIVFEGEALTPLPPGYVSLPCIEGEKMTIRECMYGLLLPSYNDCANALAVHVAGSIKAFAEMMNERARELGCKFTHFTNPSGMADDDHYTTPYDMVQIMKECVKHEEFFEITSKPYHTIPKTNKHEARYMDVTNKMIVENSPYYDPDVKGGKTGHTTPAGYNLIVYAERGDMHLICISMKCELDPQKFTSTRTLLDYGFDSFKHVSAGDMNFSALKDGSGIFGLDLLRQNRDYKVTMKASEGMIIPSDKEISDLDITFTSLDPNVEADGAAFSVDFLLGGQKLGEARVYVEGGTFSPVVNESKAYLEAFERSVMEFMAVAVLSLLLFIGLIVASVRRKKRENIPPVIDLVKARETFEKYVSAFDKDDEKIKLKLVHTYGVVEAAQEIAFRKGLSDEQIDLAGLIALLHDIGRFEQVKQYDSFEPSLMDHAAYGVKLLFEDGMIRDYITDTRYDEIIKEAIMRHSDFALAGELDPEVLLQARIIRDADKLDNCRVKLEEKVENLIGMSAEDIAGLRPTQKVLASIGGLSSVKSADRENKLDYWVSYLAYFYDINFKESFEMIREGDFINRIIDRIDYTDPVTKAQMELIRTKLHEYMEHKLKGNVNPLDGYAEELFALSEKEKEEASDQENGKEEETSSSDDKNQITEE